MLEDEEKRRKGVSMPIELFYSAMKTSTIDERVFVVLLFCCDDDVQQWICVCSVQFSPVDCRIVRSWCIWSTFFGVCVGRCCTVVLLGKVPVKLNE